MPREGRAIVFFDGAYFNELATSLGPLLKLFVVKMHEGQVIGGGLFTLCDGMCNITSAALETPRSNSPRWC